MDYCSSYNFITEPYLANMGLMKLTNTHIFVGNALNVPVDVPMGGDATIANTGVVTLVNTAVTPAIYGDATHVPQITVDSKGRITLAADILITTMPALPTDQIFVGDALNVATAVAMSGDATIVATGALTLADTGVVAAVYGDATHVSQITVDSKGRITLAADVAITGLLPAGTNYQTLYCNNVTWTAIDEISVDQWHGGTMTIAGTHVANGDTRLNIHSYNGVNALHCIKLITATLGASEMDALQVYNETTPALVLNIDKDGNLGTSGYIAVTNALAFGVKVFNNGGISFYSYKDTAYTGNHIECFSVPTVNAVVFSVSLLGKIYTLANPQIDTANAAVGKVWTATDVDGNGDWAAPSGLGSALTDAHIFVGSALNVATDVAVTGNVTISNLGVTTIANSAVTLAKMADMATASVIYRKTAGAGAPEVQTLATLKTDLQLTGSNTGDQIILPLGVPLTSNATWAGVTLEVTVDTNAVGAGALLAIGADGNWDEADADAIANMYMLAIATVSGTGANKIVLTYGQICFTGWNWTVGAPIYASLTQGTMTQTVAAVGTDDVSVVVGFALSADTMFFCPYAGWVTKT